jgi:predicted CXXCH cytochrome family protein
MKTRSVIFAGALLLMVAGVLHSQTADAFFRNATARPDNCLTCHRGAGEAAGVKYAADIHFKKGVTCAGCHGGDPTTDDQDRAMAADRGFLGVPKGDDISGMCQRCHSDAQAMKARFNSAIPVNQLESLNASVHGKSAVSGQGRMVQCVTCHGVHNIKAVKDPQSPVHPLNVNKTCATCHSSAVFMRNYNPGLPIDQEEKYKTSVHGMKHAKGDLKTAVCSSCHGSHEILKAVDAKSHVNAANLPVTCGRCHANAEYMKEYPIPTDQVAEYKTSVHGKALLEKHDLGAPSCNDCHGNHGAAPPDVESISKVCGTCHAMNASLFSESPHKKAYDELGLPECETCHGNHGIVNATDQLLGVSDSAVCSRCHSKSENPKGYQAAAMMRSMIDSLERAERRADSLVSDAEQKGMEVTEARFGLRDVRQARLQSRTAVHAFNTAKFAEVVDAGIAKAVVVEGEGQASIDEFFFRRYGLGIATLVITVLAFALWAYIKRIEKEQAGKA